MKHIIAEHSSIAYLKPGKIIISRKPIIVNTILGSCVSVTMYSPKQKAGAICHAMMPNNTEHNENLHYVDSAIHYLYSKMQEYGGIDDIVVKLFGGAQVLDGQGYSETRMGIGAQNLIQAKKTLDQIGLSITSADIGGMQARKLYFSIKTGDVYLRKFKLRNDGCIYGKLP